jgi:mannose-1-phosphate guanylyltransferase
LLQLSFDRLRGVMPPDQIYVCTSAAHADAVRANLPDLPAENLLGEPEGRDTANAIGFSAAVIARKDPNATIAVVTADHVIEPIGQFQSALRTAFQVVERHPDSLVTFGIVPTYGHTGLGYIHRGESLGLHGAYRVMNFREKPDKATADRFVESGRFYWNSGMFVWRCDTVLQELAIHLPIAHAGLVRISEAWGTADRQAVLQDVYARLPKISIDYAVMEPASQGKGKAQVVVVEMSVQWIDVGSWPALAETLDLDEHENATAAQTVLLLDSDGNIVVSQDPAHLVTTIGVSDMIVVHTRDATLVCPRAEAQRVKELVNKVKEKFGAKYL